MGKYLAISLLVLGMFSVTYTAEACHHDQQEDKKEQEKEGCSKKSCSKEDCKGCDKKEGCDKENCKKEDCKGCDDDCKDCN